MDGEDDEDDGRRRVLKAGRELLRWTQEDLAEASGVGLATIRRYEAGTRVKANTLQLLFDALVRAGAVFLQPMRLGSDDVRDGVALKATARPKPKAASGRADDEDPVTARDRPPKR